MAFVFTTAWVNGASLSPSRAMVSYHARTTTSRACKTTISMNRGWFDIQQNSLSSMFKKEENDAQLAKEKKQKQLDEIAALEAKSRSDVDLMASNLGLKIDTPIMPTYMHPWENPALYNSGPVLRTVQPTQSQLSDMAIPVVKIAADHVAAPQVRAPTPVAKVEVKPAAPAPTPVAKVEVKPAEPAPTPVAKVEVKPAAPAPTPVAKVEVKPAEPAPAPVAKVEVKPAEPAPTPVAKVEVKPAEPAPTPVAKAEVKPAAPAPTPVAKVEVKPAEPAPTPVAKVEVKPAEPAPAPVAKVEVKPAEPAPTPVSKVEVKPAEPAPTPVAKVEVKPAEPAPTPVAKVEVKPAAPAPTPVTKVEVKPAEPAPAPVAKVEVKPAEAKPVEAKAQTASKPVGFGSTVTTKQTTSSKPKNLTEFLKEPAAAAAVKEAKRKNDHPLLEELEEEFIADHDITSDFEMSDLEHDDHGHKKPKGFMKAREVDLKLLVTENKLKSLTILKLKKILKSRNLSMSGRKPDLVARLTEYIQKGGE